MSAPRPIEQLTAEQCATLTKILGEEQAQTIIPLMNIWMRQNYSTTFDYAWEACGRARRLEAATLNAVTRDVDDATRADG